MRRAVAAIVCLGLIVFVMGCGLDDYERLMHKAQQNVDSFDRANALLEKEPLALPKMKLKQGDQIVEKEPPVFLRAPRGIAKADDGQPFGGVLHHFPRSTGPTEKSGKTDKGMESTAQEKALEALRGVYVTVVTDRKELKELAGEVLQLWNQDAARTRPRQGKLPLGATVVEALDFDDEEASYTACFVRGVGSTMAAVVFRYEKGKRDTVQRVIEPCIGWMALDHRAGAMRITLSKRNKTSLFKTPVSDPNTQPKSGAKTPPAK